ncbi:hypothetical protein Pmani_022798 [Petrolisthes manimaculis]|uniref:Uncharacterized protein n=1 Tax=Petrolisthes manimaculis TaxID=1843537 RepID=A0AAE1PD87_9EUCA|nr:hypothetical protein Pmani_022798 [Petrolisthes manimaculis]
MCCKGAGRGAKQNTEVEGEGRGRGGGGGGGKKWLVEMTVSSSLSVITWTGSATLSNPSSAPDHTQVLISTWPHSAPVSLRRSAPKKPDYNPFITATFVIIHLPSNTHHLLIYYSSWDKGQDIHQLLSVISSSSSSSSSFSSSSSSSSLWP